MDDIIRKLDDAVECIENANAKGLEDEITIKIDGLRLEVRESVKKGEYYITGRYKPGGKEAEA